MKAPSISMVALVVSALAVAAAPAEEKTIEQRVEKRVVVGQDGDAAAILAEHGLDESDLDCTEEDGHQVCVAKKVITTHSGDGHTASRGYLGVHLTPISDELRLHFGAPAESGVLISKVESDSPAAAAGIEVGDVVTAVDGEAIESARDLSRLIGAREDGDLATLELYRDGRLQQVTATLEARQGHPRRGMRRHLRRHHGEIGDPGEIFELIQDSLGNIDFNVLSEQVREGLEGVDWEEIQAKIHEAFSEHSAEEH